MKHTWLAGALTGVMLAGSAAAQTQPTTPASKPAPPAATQKEKPAPPTTAKPAAAAPTEKPAAAVQKEKPAPPAPKPAAAASGEKPAAAVEKVVTTRRQAAPAPVPTGETVLGTVSIPRGVLADGKPLAGGQYTVRLTAQAAQPTVPGQLPDLNRWVEFVQGGQVKGREVVSIVPGPEVSQTMPGPDMPGHVTGNNQKVEMLKGGDYLRVWIARSGNHYLVHLPPQGATAR